MVDNILRFSSLSIGDTFSCMAITLQGLSHGNLTKIDTEHARDENNKIFEIQNIWKIKRVNTSTANPTITQQQTTK